MHTSLSAWPTRLDSRQHAGVQAITAPEKSVSLPSLSLLFYWRDYILNRKKEQQIEKYFYIGIDYISEFAYNVYLDTA
jgi:hypothetical protein